MGQVISESLEYIGRIDDNGYVFDKSGHCAAKIAEDGYITKVGGGSIYGKIDEDGTIRDSSLSVIGRIQADGYLYIHSNRVCRVSSAFIEKITPAAWNAGEASSYSGRGTSSNSYSETSAGFNWPLSFGTTLKILVGIALGIWCMIDMGDTLGFVGCLLAIPVMVAFVFIVCFIIKLFNGR